MGPQYYGWASNMVLIMLAALCCCWTSQAQPAITDWVYGLCNTGSGNTTQTWNLMQVMLALQRALSTSLYANYTYGGVYGMYQCRGDLSLAQCEQCVSNIITSAGVCADASVGTRIFLRGCYLRYENYEFLTDPEITMVTNNCSSQYNRNISSSSSMSSGSSQVLYSANVGAALNVTAQKAPYQPNYFRADMSKGSGQSTTAYALAQCMGYLSPSDCASCLSQVSNYSTLCQDSIAGEVYFVTCYYLYGNAPLLFNPTAAEAPRTPAPTLTAGAIAQKEKASSSTNPVAVVGSTVAAAVVLILAASVTAALIRRRSRIRGRQGRLNQHTRDEYLSLSDLFGLPRATQFTLQELQQATRIFDPSCKLGEGGFGPVYKGCLTNSGQEVAIKMLSRDSHQGVSEFSTEVDIITSVQHRNLIQLLGYCIEGSQRLLVYEYAPNRSLDLLLFGSDQSRVLDWRTRFKIIVGIAQGLSYLHEDSPCKIVHRDIKASNILLDDKFSPKIADFGLARFFKDDVTHVTTKVAGTLGYLAPEYALNGQLTEKADIYSFGLLVLEILSGRRIIDQELPAEEQHLLEWAWALFERGHQGELLDRKVDRAQKNADEVIRVVHVALLCTQTFPLARPAMSEVCTMLLIESKKLELPSKPTLLGFYQSHHANLFGSMSSSNLETSS